MEGDRSFRLGTSIYLQWFAQHDVSKLKDWRVYVSLGCTIELARTGTHK